MPILTPVVKLWLRRKNPRALIKASLGEDPANQRILVPGFRVWPSDVDYNLHKSNSTYAADMDVARSNAAIDLFGPFLACGGMLPIAGTTHRFMHELPPLAKYDIEISFGLFITHPRTDKKKKSLAQTASSTQPSVSGDLSPTIKKLTSNRPDGAIVHAVSVSTFCFKIGRLTIPPSVVLSLGGHGTPANNARFAAIHAGGPRAVVKYLKGGWKEDDEAVKVVESYQQQGKALGDRGDVIRTALEDFRS
ncbi:hypothetical protein HD553DRAFT_346409 [Filobasidium floriforme]|uniref:uncharacterized protein n=1 Tax=Filobasidium floriforme TaxID=5210 RepID=UPI001E8D26A9|nr:uncharacterized protein HD553DRAFT_346409 [Filobasidium floriforme]KAH8078028.1 hypothetical protein HD553DRAFT_346409 [Filobasidium floriforme]